MVRGVTVIVPFRGREVPLSLLLPRLLKPGRNVAHIVVAEQGNTASFNRGAIKNAGFNAAMRDLKLAPTDTVCFHDVDTIPEDGFGAYPSVKPGEIVHLYGHEHCLGGVFCITVGDFQRLGMFNHWGGWGREDADLQLRAVQRNLTIDRSRFQSRFSPSAQGFLEVTEDGRRETPQSIKAQLDAKLRDSAGKPATLSQGAIFRTGMLVVSIPAVRHYMFL